MIEASLENRDPSLNSFVRCKLILSTPTVLFEHPIAELVARGSFLVIFCPIDETFMRLVHFRFRLGTLFLLCEFLPFREIDAIW